MSKKNKFGNVQINHGNCGSIQINGKTFQDHNISISGNKVIIDGVVQTDSEFKCQVINIEINGDVGSIHSEAADVTVSGSVTGSIKTSSGDIECGDVQGDVSSMSGDVKCGVVHGDVSTMSGDIRRR